MSEQQHPRPELEPTGPAGQRLADAWREGPAAVARVLTDRPVAATDERAERAVQPPTERR